MCFLKAGNDCTSKYVCSKHVCKVLGASRLRFVGSDSKRQRCVFLLCCCCQNTRDAELAAAGKVYARISVKRKYAPPFCVAKKATCTWKTLHSDYNSIYMHPVQKIDTTPSVGVTARLHVPQQRATTSTLATEPHPSCTEELKPRAHQCHDKPQSRNKNITSKARHPASAKRP